MLVNRIALSHQKSIAYIAILRIKAAFNCVYIVYTYCRHMYRKPDFLYTSKNTCANVDL